jgi:A/G-specific adenine glycosylase
MAGLAEVQERLLAWFAAHQRALPWRERYSPYAVWVSEVMLQQTQMDRAVAYFTRWMERFPDVVALAAADEEEVLRLWEGLGYYSRARNLHRAAQVLAAEHGGVLPNDEAALRALPGVGRYTANAVRSLAFQEDVPVVDANVGRVFARVFDLDEPVGEPAVQRRLWDTAAKLVPPGRAREWNQALMELGALVCRKRPRCGECPLAEHCEALRLGIADQRPVPGKGKDIMHIEIVCGALVHQGRVFIQKRRPGSVWGGLWEFPGGRLEPGETPEQAVAREFAEELDFTLRSVDKIAVVKHGYTTYRVTLHCFLCDLDGAVQQPQPVLRAATAFRWALPQELDGFAFPAGHRKFHDQLRRDLRFQARLEAR